jgi:ketosteroid isomerase-like protein
MALTNAEAMREIMLRAVDGTEAGVQAAAALIADDVRIWQQGAGWMTRTAKMESWRRGLGAPLPTTIRSLVEAGDQVAVEATISASGRDVLVAFFATFRDGRLVAGREYFTAAPPADVFGD